MKLTKHAFFLRQDEIFSSIESPDKLDLSDSTDSANERGKTTEPVLSETAPQELGQDISSTQSRLRRHKRQGDETEDTRAEWPDLEPRDCRVVEANAGAGPRPQMSSLVARTPPKNEIQTRATVTTTGSPKGVFAGLVFFFVPPSRTNKARAARMKKVEAQSGIVLDEFDSALVTHVVVDKNISVMVMMKHLKINKLPSKLKVMNELWTPDCVMFSRIVEGSVKYSVDGLPLSVQDDVVQSPIELQELADPSQPQSLQIRSPKRRRKAISPACTTLPSSGITESPTIAFGRDYDENIRPVVINKTKDELDITISTMQALGTIRLEDEEECEPFARDTVRPRAVEDAPVDEGPNDYVISKLIVMQKYYETSPHAEDKWKPRGYRLAITALRSIGKAIRSYDDAIKIPHIGERIALHIEEISKTGNMARTDNFGEEYQVVQKFLGIYGVGPATAHEFVRQKLRSFQDLHRSGLLTANQKIGIELYDDLNTRVPRLEVQQHKRIVTRAARSIDAELQLYTMGSYRRGAVDCGDIDIMITKPKTTKRDLVKLWQKLLAKLQEMKFLTHALVVSDRVDGLKWQGISRLDIPGALHRRIDFLLVPWEQRGPALLYFTGNDLFNRSMRLLARKKGYTLNEKALLRGAIRSRGVKLSEGENTGAQTEEEIFSILGIPFRTPEERCVC